MSKDNYLCIFQKPKVVYCLYYPSNISSHSESSGANTGQNKTRSKTCQLLGAFWHCFLNKFPNFLIRKLKKNAPFRSFFAGRGLLAVSGHYRLITSAHERTLLGHVSWFHQSRARRNIWWIINDNTTPKTNKDSVATSNHTNVQKVHELNWVLPRKFIVHEFNVRYFAHCFGFDAKDAYWVILILRG